MRFSMIAAAWCLLISTALAAEPKLIGHWPLTSDAKDASGNHRHGTAQAVEFAATGAAFNGRGSRIDVADAPQLGTGDFSISLWVHTEEQLDDAIGDLISQYDPVTRTGFNLSVKHHAGVTGSQAIAEATNVRRHNWVTGRSCSISETTMNDFVRLR